MSYYTAGDTIRVTATDIASVIQHKNNYVNNVLPPGSNFTIEMYFNGEGGFGIDEGGTVCFDLRASNILDISFFLLISMFFS